MPPRQPAPVSADATPGHLAPQAAAPAGTPGALGAAAATRSPTHKGSSPTSPKGAPDSLGAAVFARPLLKASPAKGSQDLLGAAVAARRAKAPGG